MKRQLSLSEWRLVSRIGFTSLVLSAFALAVAVPGLVFGSIFMSSGPEGLNSSGAPCNFFNCSLIRSINQIHPFEQDLVLIGGNGITISGGPHSLTIDASITLMVPPEFNVTFEMGQMYFNKREQDPHTVWAVGSVRGLPEFRRLDWSDLPPLHSALLDGQFLIGKTGEDSPSPGYLTAAPGGEIVVTNSPGGIQLALGNALSITDLSVSGSTFLGTNTTCVSPIHASCYDISGQSCPTGSLNSNCFPVNAQYESITVNSLTVLNSTILGTILNQDFFNVTNLITDTLTLKSNMTCPGTALIHQDCIDISGKTCPLGIPISESCIPASLVFFDLDVTHNLTVNNVKCDGGVLEDSCIPTRVARINGMTGLDFTIQASGAGIQVNSVSNGIEVINTVANTPQASNLVYAGGPGLPSFRSLQVSDLPAIQGFGSVSVNSSGGFINITGNPPNLVAGANIVLTQAGDALVISATPDGVGGNGTVVSVGLTAPVSLFHVTGSPITEMGTLGLSLLNQPGNHVFAGGSPPAFRALDLNDLPLPSLGNGQLYIGAGGTPVAAGLSAGTGISITPGPGTVVISALGSGAISSQEVIGVGISSTTSSTYVLVSDMTVTPVAGTYIVTFSASGVLELGSSDAKCALFKNGAVIGHTERRFGWNGGVQTSGYEVALHTQGIITVSGSEAIEVRHLTSGGKLFSVSERSMILIRV